MIQNVLREYRRAREQHEQNVLGRAQQIFSQYHAKCYWHLRKDLKISSDNLSIVQNGLKKYGVLEGLRLASELELTAG